MSMRGLKIEDDELVRDPDCSGVMLISGNELRAGHICKEDAMWTELLERYDADNAAKDQGKPEQPNWSMRFS